MNCTESGGPTGRKPSKPDVGTTTVKPPSRAEWEDALRGAMNNHIAPTGLTVEELMAMSGWGEKKVRQYLRRMLADKTVVCYLRGRQSKRIDGTLYMVPTYGLLRKAKNEFRKRKSPNKPSSKESPKRPRRKPAGPID